MHTYKYSGFGPTGLKFQGENVFMLLSFLIICFSTISLVCSFFPPRTSGIGKCFKIAAGGTGQGHDENSFSNNSYTCVQHGKYSCNDTQIKIINSNTSRIVGGDVCFSKTSILFCTLLNVARHCFESLPCAF